jgi:hypothetical protein
VVREFSQRRRQIEAAAAEAGDRSVGARRRLAVTTRYAKDVEVDEEALTAAWHRRAAAHGVDEGVVAGWCDPARASAYRSHSSDAVMAERALGGELTEHVSTFDRRDVLVRLAGSATSGASVSDLEARADRFVATPAVVAVGDGLTGVRWTTAELLAVEAALLERADARRDEHVGVCRDPTVVRDRYPELGAEQRAMVAAITSDGAGISVVVGAAGTGKTVALAAAADAWREDGYQVLGSALAARTAAGLQATTGIPSSSLDLLLTSLDQPASPGFRPRTVVVVDEAAMVGTRTLARLLDHAHAARAKVVLVGDHHQLPEIHAGGAFAALARRLGAVELDTNRRQRDPVERHAATELRTGDAARALGLLDEHGRLHRCPSVDDAHARIVAAWYEARLRGQEAIMLAPTRAESTDLNRRARRLLRTDGAFSDQHLVARGREFALGDEVMTLRNSYRLGLLNGRRGHVSAIDLVARTVTVTFDADTIVTIPARYLDAGHLDHAYAMTIHKAQGITCDVALVAGGERLHREAAYTALTRGRDENHLYIAHNHEDVRDHDWHRAERSADMLRRSLERSDRQTLAHEQRSGGTLDAWSALPEPPAREPDDGIDLTA